MALLETQGLRARYGGIEAVHGIDLTVERGTIVALLGANGAGKTSTLRAITGAATAQGTIVFDDAPLRGVRPERAARLGIAHASEGRGTLSEFSVRENLALGAYTDRDAARVRARRRRIHGYFTTDLAEREHQRAGSLSGGEQQQLAIARALMLDPKLMLLDEPSLGLAPILVRGIFDLLRAINREEGLTILLAEQNAAIAPGRRRAALLRARSRPYRRLRSLERTPSRRSHPAIVPWVLSAKATAVRSPLWWSVTPLNAVQAGAHASCAPVSSSSGRPASGRQRFPCICTAAGVTARHFYGGFDLTVEAMLPQIADEIAELAVRAGAERASRTSPARRCSNGSRALSVYFAYLTDDPRRARIYAVESSGVSADVCATHRRATREAFIKMIVPQQSNSLARIREPGCCTERSPVQPTLLQGGSPARPAAASTRCSPADTAVPAQARAIPDRSVEQHGDDRSLQSMRRAPLLDRLDLDPASPRHRHGIVRGRQPDALAGPFAPRDVSDGRGPRSAWSATSCRPSALRSDRGSGWRRWPGTRTATSSCTTRSRAWVPSPTRSTRACIREQARLRHQPRRRPHHLRRPHLRRAPRSTRTAVTEGPHVRRPQRSGTELLPTTLLNVRR